MRKRHLLAVSLALLLIMLGAIQAAASIGGLSVAPAHFDPNNPATRSYFILSIPAGASVTDEVRVGNASQQTLHVIVSSVDGLTGQTSGAVYANRQDPVVKAGGWVTTEGSKLSVAPVTSVLLGFTVRVPANATPGDHLAGIAFEDANPQTSGRGIQVTTVIREVVGVLIKVPGPAVASACVRGWRIGQFSETTRTATVFVDLAATGQLLAKPKLTVDLRGPGGYYAVRSRQLDTILPGDRIEYPFIWPDSLAAGVYTATLTANACSLTAQFQLGSGVSGNAPGSKPVPADERAAGAAVPPWVIILGCALLLVVVAIFFIYLVLRRRGDERKTKEFGARIMAHSSRSK